VVESAEAFEAELADPLGWQLPRHSQLLLDPIDDQLEIARVDVALVGGADQRASQLRAIEGLALPTSLDHRQRLRLAPLIGGEAMAAARAPPAPANGVSVIGAPGLEDPGGGLAARAIHHRKSTRTSVPANVGRYM
jgi:hypothetical protein